MRLNEAVEVEGVLATSFSITAVPWALTWQLWAGRAAHFGCRAQGMWFLTQELCRALGAHHTVTALSSPHPLCPLAALKTSLNSLVFASPVFFYSCSKLLGKFKKANLELAVCARKSPAFMIE